MTDMLTVIRRSAEYRLHPLGFFYLEDRIAKDRTRRTHVWLPGSSNSPENDRHQHSFDINSSVVLGCIRSELFRFQEIPSGTEREFAVTYDKGRSILLPTGRIGNLELISAFETAAGSSYFLRAGVIHRVAASEKPCITILTTQEHGVPIFSYGSNESEPRFERRLVTAREECQIDEIFDRIAARQLVTRPPARA
jgi:hypothetical protein